MPRLPRITGPDAVRAMAKDGWLAARTRGSHVMLRHSAKPGRVVVPIHSGKILKPKTLLSILDQAGMSPERLRALL